MLLGPSLPKALYGHAMVTLDKDVVALGGYSSGSQSSLYLMTCQNKVCEWQTMSQKLKIDRASFVAMLIPDELTDCGKNFQIFIFKIKHFQARARAPAGRESNFWRENIFFFKIQITWREI